MDLYFANKGSGKTTILSKLAQKELKKISKGKSIYKFIISNAPIQGVRYIEDIRMILKEASMQDCLVLIDEGSIVYNNREMAMNTMEKRFFKLERHLETKVVIVSQDYADIDITIRRLYDNMYLLIRLPFITLIRPIKKYITIDEISHQIIDNYKFKSIFSWKFILRKNYFKYFNTHWLPRDINIFDPNELEEINFIEKHKKDSIIYSIQKLLRNCDKLFLRIKAYIKA